MSQSCKYTKGNYSYIIELSNSEYAEVLDKREEIAEKKRELADLLNMYEKLEPSRVYAVPKQLELDLDL